VNAAGDVVVGSSGGPVYWEDGLLVPLGGEGIPYGVSADGDVIVGWDHIHPNDSEAVRWVDGAFERLGDLPGGGFSSHAWDVSANGSVVVGYGTDENDRQPARWEGGSLTALPLLPGHETGTAYAVSVDGRIIAGHSDGQAVRWVDGVPEALPMLLDATVPIAYDVTDDGSVVVGSFYRGGLSKGFLWREGVGTAEIPPLTPGGFLQAHAISGDGTLVAGLTLVGAFVWTAARGTRLLEEVLEDDYGLDLTGWHLVVVDYHGVNADGTVIVGEGYNPKGEYEGWRAVLPPWPVAVEPEAPAPTRLTLTAGPNPFRSRTTFRLTLPEAGPATLAVYDVLGREVALLHDGLLAAGAHAFAWDASALPAGVYLARLRLGDRAEAVRVTRLD